MRYVSLTALAILVSLATAHAEPSTLVGTSDEMVSNGTAVKQPRLQASAVNVIPAEAEAPEDFAGCEWKENTQHIRWHSGLGLYEMFVPVDGKPYDVAGAIKPPAPGTLQPGQSGLASRQEPALALPAPRGWTTFRSWMLGAVRGMRPRRGQRIGRSMTTRFSKLMDCRLSPRLVFQSRSRAKGQTRARAPRPTRMIKGYARRTQ